MYTGLSAYAQTADKLFVGPIYTLDPEQPWAQAMAIAGDTILAIGKEKELGRFVGPVTTVVRLAGKQMILPGFIDSHTHLVDGGDRLSSIHLREVKTPKAFIDSIAAYAKQLKRGEWITGGSWDHQNWNGELPSRDWIDSVTPYNPVALVRLDGHTLLANSLAMKLIGITEDVPDTLGGEILRKEGRLTGIFKDNARYLIARKIPPAGMERKQQMLQAAMHYMVTNGITSVVSVTGTGRGNYWEVYEKADKEKQLILRIYAAKEMEDWEQLAGDAQGSANAWLKSGAVKGFIDGSLGSHTAAFKEAFSDNPSDSGIFVTNKEVLYKRMKGADSLGLQIMIHTIGDRAVATYLDLAERLIKENGRKDRRMRMEHAQHLSPQDFERFSNLGVIASMQPYHIIDDGRWAEKVIGKARAQYAFPVKELLDHGVKVIFGSDWYVAPASPLLGIYAAVTRRTLDGKHPNGWIPKQRISVQEAIKAYTIDAAYGMYEETSRGSLETGKLADFVILDQHILEIPVRKIPGVQVLNTYVGGKEVFRK